MAERRLRASATPQGNEVLFKVYDDGYIGDEEHFLFQSYFDYSPFFDVADKFYPDEIVEISMVPDGMKEGYEGTCDPFGIKWKLGYFGTDMKSHYFTKEMLDNDAFLSAIANAPMLGDTLVVKIQKTNDWKYLMKKYDVQNLWRKCKD